MVFESMVVDILNRFLGSYVQNLDSSQLKLGIWGGDVVLQNLLLKENALDDLDLPVKTISGQLGKLTMKIPWKNLYTAPVIVIIEEFVLLTVPRHGVKYDAEKEEKIAWDTKQGLLKKLDEARRIELERKKPKSDEKDTFTEKLVAQVIKNLQVKIQDIHVRYEDDICSPGRPFAFGVTLHNLSFETTNDHWKVGLASDATKMIYKLITLNSLAVYWNSKQTKLFRHMTEKERTAAFKNGIATKAHKPSKMHFVLGPIFSTVKLQMNPKPEADKPEFSIAKIFLTIIMDELSIALSKFQYQDILILSQSLEWLATSAKYTKYRPSVPHKGHAKEWWLFAYNCVLEEDVRRAARNWSWKHIKRHRKNCKKYKEAYKARLMGTKAPTDTVLVDLEKELDFFNLALVRKQADMEFERSGGAQAQEKKQGGWFGGWFGEKKDTAKQESSIAKQFEQAMTTQEKEKLMDAIGYQENMTPAVYPKEFVENKLKFELKKLTVTVLDDSTPGYVEVTHLLLENVLSSLEQRPAGRAIKLKATVDKLTVNGMQSAPNASKPLMVTTQHGVSKSPPTSAKSSSPESSKSTALLDVRFETNPLDGRCDYRLHVLSKPLEILYNADTINHMAVVFKPPKSVELYSKLQQAAHNTMEGIKEASALSMQYAIEQHKHLDLHLDLKAPYVIIPHGGVMKRGVSSLIIDMGNLKMQSKADKAKSSMSLIQLTRSGASQDEILKEVMQQAYEEYKISLLGIQILLAGPDDDWKEARAKSVTPLHLWCPTNLDIKLDKCILTDDPRLPKLKIKGELPSIQVSVSDVKVIQLAKLLVSIPFAEDTGESERSDEAVQTNLARSRVGSVSSLRAVKIPTKHEAKAQAESETQVTIVELSFEVGQVGFKLLKEKEGVEAEIIDFRLKQIGIHMKQRTHEMKADVYIGDITLEDKEFQMPDGQPLYIIHTPGKSATKLLSCQYFQISKKNPGYNSLYHKIQQLIKINFSVVRLLLHQDALLSLMAFSNQLNSEISSIMAKPSNQQATATPTVAKERRISTNLPTDGKTKASVAATLGVVQRRAKHHSGEEDIMLKVVAKLDTVSCIVCSNERSIVDVKVAGLEADVAIQKSKTVVNTVLKTVEISDPGEDVLHNQILSVVGQEVVNVRIVNYNFATTGDGYKDMSKVDTSIRATISGIRIVFLNKFVMDVLGFLNNFQAAVNAVKDATAKVAEAAMENVQSVYQKASRVSLSINMKAPLILMPRNSHSVEVLMLDMGKITIANTFHLGKSGDCRGVPMPPLMETLQLKLQNFKVSRSLLSTDASVEISECHLFDPMFVSITVIRNLSGSWCQDVPEMELNGNFGSIVLSMSQEDYNILMHTLNENLAEKPDEPPPSTAAVVAAVSLPSECSSVLAEVKKTTAVTVEATEQSTKKVATPRYKFNFKLEEISAKLYFGKTNLKEGLVVRKPSQALAKFELQVIAVKGEMLTDDSMWANVVLVNCILDDVRENNNSCITRLMERATGKKGTSNMIDVTFRKDSKNNTFMKTKISSFLLVACPDYLMTISEFFTKDVTSDDGAGPSSGVKPPPAAEIKQGMHVAAPQVQEATPPPEGSLTFVLDLDQPDIILVEDVSDINTEALILNHFIKLTYKKTPERQTLSGTISNLQILGCRYNPSLRNDTKAEILSPCEINISVPNMDNDGGMNIDIDISDVVMHTAPGTVRLLTSISSMFQAVKIEEVTVDNAPGDYTELWNVKKVDKFDFWYLKPEVGQDALEVAESSPVVTKAQQLIVKAKTMILTFEAGVGNQTVPMLLFEAGFFADVRNWSQALYVHGVLTLEMLCYNEKMALWEPFIERVETPKGSRPWELMLEMSTWNEAVEAAGSPSEPDVDDIVFEPPKSSITISSADSLELCVTKTSLDVLTNLGQSFSDAVNLVPESKRKDEPKCPFLVKNTTGMPITLVLKDEEFTLCDPSSQDVSEVVLEPDASVSLTVKVDPVLNARKSVLKMQEMTSEKKLLVKVADMNAVRQISVKRADRRFFHLPEKTYPGDQWGIVSDIKAMYGCKVITLRSVLQVVNNFMVPIEVYYMSREKDKLVCCGVVEPSKHFDVPVAAVYTNTNEVFFRPKESDYAVSSTSFVWKDLVKNPSQCKKVECVPRNKKGGKSFFINVIGSIDQVFFEETKRKTLASTCFVLHLKPSAIFKNFLPIPVLCSNEKGEEEKEVMKGQSIELGWSEVDDTNITLKIMDYLGENWTGTRKLQSDTPDLSVWTFEGPKSDSPPAVMDLGLHTVKDHDCQILSLYCPFWMLNKTDHLLTYKSEDGNIMEHRPKFEGPILFSCKAKNFFARKKALLKFEDSDWSDKFSVDVVGSSGTVKCKSKTGMQYEVGVHIKMTSFSLTKIIMFTPYYMVVNSCKYEVQFVESGGSDWISVEPNQTTAFWPKQQKQCELVVKVKDTKEESKPFCYDDTHTTLLRLDNQYGGIEVDCQMNEASVILTFSEYEAGSATVRLVNSVKNCSITYHQSGEKTTYSVGPHQTVLYTWDNPNGKHELLWNSVEKKDSKVDLVKDGVGEFQPYDKNEEQVAYWVSFLDDTQRVLLFTDDLTIATRAHCAGELERVDQDITIAIEGIGVSVIDNPNKMEVLYLSLASSGIVWEVSKERSRRYKPLPVAAGASIEAAYQSYITNLKLGEPASSKQVLENKYEVDFEANLLLKPHKRKLRRSFQQGIWFSYKTSPHRKQLHAKINRLQIDNQMPDCVFPVVLAPVPLPKTVAADNAPKPFAEVSIMMRKSDYSTVQQYKYFKVLIQEFHIKIDQAFISGVMEMISKETAVDNEAQFLADMDFLKTTLKDLAETQAGQEQRNYYDLLHFSPLKVHISFSMQGCGGEGPATKSSSSNLQGDFLNLFVQSVGVTLTEIQDVVFKLAYFERQHRFVSQKQLMNEAITHYSGQAIKQMYVLVLGLDVIGNPFGLVVGLGQGVEDLFYEPFQGAIQGPEEFAEGLALGVRSLFGHAVGGAAGAVSRITGTLGKGVAALTLDEDYQRKRREAQMHRSANFHEGMAQSGKGLVMGVFDGVTGVFTKPIHGAKEEGVEGFFKGVGKGMVGLVTRPTAGVIDFASGTFDSVKRAAETSSETNRCRPARFFQPDGVVRPYNKHEAEGNKLLKDVEKGKYASTDTYVGHVAVSVCGKFIVLITDLRVIMVSKGDIFGQWTCDWQVPWNEMKGSATFTDKGVVIPLKEPKKKKLGLFGSGENSKTIALKNKDVGEWIVAKIEEAKEVKE